MTILTEISSEITAETADAQLQLLEALAQRYRAFSKVRPLALGIHNEILADWPDLSPELLKATLKRYTRSFQYRRKLARPGSHRVHLDGSSAGEVSAEHRDSVFPKRKPKPPAPPDTPAAPPEPNPAPVQAEDTPPARPVLRLKSKTNPAVSAAVVVRKVAAP